MANRHLSRSIVLQSLFEWDFRNLAKDAGHEAFERNLLEFAGDHTPTNDRHFTEHLFDGIVSKKKDLDLIIEKAAPDWPIDKISILDRNILRLGLYELLFADRSEVPPKVAINEAIELAKTFGSETSGKFVNGVLGAVYKELGEPGKDEKSQPRDKRVEKVTNEELGGAVVYAKTGDDIQVALVHDVFGRWTLSKGKIEPGEDVRQATVREIKEELGVDVELEDELGTNEYGTFHPEKGKLKKRVHYFLAKANFEELKLGTSGGLDDARWFKLSDILDLNFYNDILPLITKAVNILLKK